MANSYRWRDPAKPTEPGLATADPAESAIDLIADGAERYAARPAQRAQDLISDAWEATGARRAALARQALALWPDCADAYVLLAQDRTGLQDKRELLERGVAAGERALGGRVFSEDAGDFWLIFETRPYMRARATLAAVLWRLHRHEEAVAHQRELLALNPRDNQGLRYRQANWLLALEAYDELERLFAAHAGEGNVPRVHLHPSAGRVRSPRPRRPSVRAAHPGARAQPAHPRLPHSPQQATETAPRLHRVRRGQRGGRLRRRRWRAVG